MKKTKLLDFSVFNAITVLLSYAIIIFIMLYITFNNEKFWWAGLIGAVLLLLSLLTIIWFYVVLSPYIDDKGVHHGNKIIPVSNLKIRNDYNMRFKEEQIIFEDKYIKYDKLSKEELKKSRIAVQNTRMNVKKINAYIELYNINR